ncbi:hypothetical protein [Sulfurovum sp.]|uniref:hypothetical protein n=1 Tax=Sulfurovum sp. TaxID=1969726 RepID=UPI002867D170|nr:hypothetical protein [Sulfurovum sp.]
MRHLLIILILLLSFTGCEDKEQLAKEQANHDAKIAQQARAELLAELEAEKDAKEKENTRLNDMGIRMDDGTITIDTNKTKEFIEDLNTKMTTQIKKFSEDMKKGIIDAEESGIEINEKHIYVDLNKTQNLFEDWAQKIQILVEEFGTAAESADTNNTNKGI